jgi:AcrR family transcriptional regulator
MSQFERQSPTRKDAVANREKLLAGAESYFAEYGVDAPLHGLAEHADVGVGTLYRNFPNADALLDELHVRSVSRWSGVVSAAAATTTGWEGLRSFVTEGTQLLCQYPATASIARRQMRVTERQRMLSDWNQTIGSILERAKTEGSVRDDLTTDQLAALPFRLATADVCAVVGEDRAHLHTEAIEWMLALLRATAS